MKAFARLSLARKGLLVLGAMALLVGFNYAVFSKTQTLQHGQVVKLKLAPRDPRGLLTGDYMTLNYEIANRLRGAFPDRQSADGYVLVGLNAEGVAEYVSHGSSAPNPGPQQLALQFRQRGRDIKFATNAYYFQEGQAKTFERARYGEFRVSQKGELLLTNLLDEGLQRLSSHSSIPQAK